jgi:tRNA 2-thiouridine synthesizing protein A
LVEINCLGDMCPVPVLKLKDKLKSLPDKESIKIITDHSCVLESIQDVIKRKKGYKLSFEEVANGIWEIEVRKT